MSVSGHYPLLGFTLQPQSALKPTPVLHAFDKLCISTAQEQQREDICDRAPCGSNRLPSWGPLTPAISVEPGGNAVEEEKGIKRKADPAPPPVPDGGWQMARRKRNTGAATPNWRHEHRIDFVIENPAHGFLWRMDFTNELLQPAETLDARRLLTKDLTTSYCKYGFPYRKDTRFYTTLTDMTLKPQCSRYKCEDLLASGKTKHKEVLSGASRNVSNTIPEGIIVGFLKTWYRKHKGNPKIKGYIFVDPFAGTESVVKTVNNHKDDIFERCPVKVISNLFEKKVAVLHEDMATWTLADLTAVSMAVDRKDFLDAHTKEPLQLKDCAVLYWISTECKTYSTNALSKHRKTKLPDGTNDKEPTSKEAEQDDKMNARLFKELQRSVLTPPEP